MMLGDTRLGTLLGEFMRSTMQFKAFPIMMMTMHLRRGLNAARAADFGGYLASLMVGMTVRPPGLHPLQAGRRHHQAGEAPRGHCGFGTSAARRPIARSSTRRPHRHMVRQAWTAMPLLKCPTRWRPGGSSLAGCRAARIQCRACVPPSPGSRPAVADRGRWWPRRRPPPAARVPGSPGLPSTTCFAITRHSPHGARA